MSQIGGFAEMGGYLLQRVVVQCCRRVRVMKIGGGLIHFQDNRARFQTPSVLSEEMLILGVSVKEWNEAFIGSFERSLPTQSNLYMRLGGRASPLQLEE